MAPTSTAASPWRTTRRETVDPGDLAGTADESDAEVVYQPEHSEADIED
jgi:hypothetical protein